MDLVQAGIIIGELKAENADLMKQLRVSDELVSELEADNARLDGELSAFQNEAPETEQELPVVEGDSPDFGAQQGE